jgi:hypothetical protein
MDIWITKMSDYVCQHPYKSNKNIHHKLVTAHGIIESLRSNTWNRLLLRPHRTPL